MSPLSNFSPSSDFPPAPLYYIETLWFQVAGTLCNLACSHCLVSASPTNRTHLMMPLSKVREVLKEADRLGVREFYFTGGEPFLNRDMPMILEATLNQGPANVLTNGTLITDALARALKEMSDRSLYSLELRISLDGASAETNDPLRGPGTFERILQGIRRLAAVGLNPVLTVTEASPDLGGAAKGGREAFYELLRSLGLQRPRVKILSLFHIGEEAKRSQGYQPSESLRGMHLTPEDLLKLQCTTSRIVTQEGVYVCPILVNVPPGRMGDTLTEGLRDFVLDQGACYTCHAYGVTCRT